MTKNQIFSFPILSRALRIKNKNSAVKNFSNVYGHAICAPIIYMNDCHIALNFKLYEHIAFSNYIIKCIIEC